MTFYPDASVLLAAVLDEPGSASAIATLDGREDLVASEWLLTEIASALGIKCRAKLIDAATRRSALSACRAIIADSGTMLPIVDGDFRRAGEWIERSALRAGDALHLAIAERHRAAVWTFDKRMAEGGQALGLDVHLLR